MLNDKMQQAKANVQYHRSEISIKVFKILDKRITR